PQTLTIFGSGTLNGYGQFNGNIVHQGSSPIEFYGPTIIEGQLFVFGASNTVIVSNAQTEVMNSTFNSGTISVQTGGKFVSVGGVNGNPVSGALAVDPGGEIVASFLQQNSLTIGGSAGSPGVVTLRKRSEGGGTTVLNTLAVAGGATPLGRIDI